MGKPMKAKKAKVPRLTEADYIEYVNALKASSTNTETQKNMSPRDNPPVEKV